MLRLTVLLCLLISISAHSQESLRIGILENKCADGIEFKLEESNFTLNSAQEKWSLQQNWNVRIVPLGIGFRLYLPDATLDCAGPKLVLQSLQAEGKIAIHIPPIGRKQR